MNTNAVLLKTQSMRKMNANQIHPQNAQMGQIRIQIKTTALNSDQCGVSDRITTA